MLVSARAVRENMEAVDKTRKLAKPVSGDSADRASQHASNPESALRDQLAQLGGRDQGWGSVPEDEIIRILPLFIQVSQSCGVMDGLDLQGLAYRCAQIVVSHVQQKLPGQPAEEGRFEVEQFFQEKAEVRDSRGWLLLHTLSLLSAQSPEVVRAIIGTELLSALVKCLYLFVVIPPRKDRAEEDTALCSFQDTFTQVILQLCGQVHCVETLVETQELQCLIIALTSLWEHSSSVWRRRASRVLRAVSAAQTRNVVPVLRAKNSMKICIQNLLKIPDQVPGPLLAEVAVGVFSFVKDSYPHDVSLFEEFENNEGYMALQTIMSRCEGGVMAEDRQAVQDFLDLLAAFTLYGRAELKVALCVSNPQPPGFKFDPVLTKGRSVKNLTAFRIIQASFLHSDNIHTCSQILQTVRKIWTWDKANFFLLEWTLQSLAQLAGCISRKPPAVHTVFLELLEMVVLQLSYIPHEALLEVVRALERADSVPFNSAALGCLHGLVLHTELFCDVLRDAGLLQQLLEKLKKQAKLLRKAGVSGQNAGSCDDFPEKILTCQMLKVVAALAVKSVRNTVFIRDYGMIPYVKIFVNDGQLRGLALIILEQASQINPEEYMSSTIGALCSSTEAELDLRQDLLKSILKVLEEPHSWRAFRTAGGFTGLLSIVVDMAGALGEAVGGSWASLEPTRVRELLFLTLHTLATAVQLHQLNEHCFRAAGHYERLAEALLDLGCFPGKPQGHSPGAHGRSSWRTFWQLKEAAASPRTAMPVPLQDCLRLLGFLERFALGMDAEGEPGGRVGVQDATPHAAQALGEDTGALQGRKATNSMSSAASSCNSRFDEKILHPGAIHVIMILLPKIFCPVDPQLSVEVQLSLAHHIQSLVKLERNRQIMCESGLLDTLLTHCQDILDGTDDPLHLPVVRIFEKMASQAIDPYSLRRFLCLGQPLMCAVEDTPGELTNPAAQNGCNSDVAELRQSQETKAPKKKLKHSYSLLTMSPNCTIPHHRVVSLISMTSPRTLQPHRVTTMPSFVEFDMRFSGYGCLFLPSVATVKGVSADSIETGGIGTDCRGFPPAAGLSFSTWFFISQFSSARDAHPVRLLTMVRHMSRAELQYSCLTVSVSCPDRYLVVSTEEESFQFLDMMEPDSQAHSSLPAVLRFNTSKQLVPAQWHHLVLTIAKDIKKNCWVTVYLNGTKIGTSKMKYIQPFPGLCISMDPTRVIDVCGIIGTPLLWKQPSSLIWRVGPTYLFEEVLTHEAVEVMYSQGTKYIGNYQALCPLVNDDTSIIKIIAEERISFGINPEVATVTTVAEVREVYNEVDCRLIAKEMGITSRDSCTPVYLLKNISQHLSGTSRTIGATLIGHSGVRKFQSHSAVDSFQYIGGPAVVLSFVAMASDDSSLYAAVKVLLSVLSTSPGMEREMNRIQGYKMLAFLLKKKSRLISNRTFQLLLSITGSMELGCSASVLNLSAFQDLLCDFEVWRNAPESLDFLVLNHFANILKSPSCGQQNAQVMHSLGVVNRMLFLLSEPGVTCQQVSIITTIVKLLLVGHFNTTDLCRLGLFMIYTLLPPSLNENVIFSDADMSSPALSQTPARSVWIRNQLLEMLLSLTNSDRALPVKNQEDMFFALGPDWFLLFLQEHLHSSTVLRGLKLLACFLSTPVLLTKFRERVTSGSLLQRLQGESPIFLDNLKAQAWPCEVLSSTCGGFQVLQKLLLHHVGIPQVYGILAVLLLRKTDFESLTGKLDIDEVLQGVIDCGNGTTGLLLCADVAIVLLELVRVIISEPLIEEEASWKTLYPGSVMQFFCLVHSMYPKDPLWASPAFLHSLAGTVFPPEPCEDTLTSESMLQTAHPARKQVCDFIRILLMDSLINVPAKDQPHPLVLLLESSPEVASHEQKQTFQTEMLEFLMDIVHMTCQEEGQCTHVARNDTGPDGQVTTLIENVSFFSKKLVEKLYAGMFVVEPEKLLVFISEQIAVAIEKARGQREEAVNALYSSINRALLYFLSRPRQTPDEQRLVLQAMEVLQQQWDVVLATYNGSLAFLTCLQHCLFLIKSGSYTDGFGCGTHKKHTKKIWRHLFPHKNSSLGVVCEAPDSAEVESQLQSLADAMWGRLMAERRAMLEEAYKIDISAKPGGKDGALSMADMSPLWEETGVKAWQLFIDSQKKKLNRAQQGKHSPLKAAVRSAQKRLARESFCMPKEYLLYMESQQSSAQEIFENLRKNHTQAMRCEEARVGRRWASWEEDLLRERGLFGPGPGVLVSRGWVQDGSEGPGRTRPRIRRKALRRSKKFPASRLSLQAKWDPVEEGKAPESTEAETEPFAVYEAAQEEGETTRDCEQLTFFPSLKEPSSPVEEPSELCSSTQLVLQELAEAEQVKSKLGAVIVNGHIVTEGVLVFGLAHFYICEGFTLSSTGEVCCTCHHPSSFRDSFICGMLNKDKSDSGPSCRRHPYEDIKEAHFMRFLLQDNALEVFMRNGQSAFLVFQNKDHVQAFKKFCSAVPLLKGRGIAEAITNIRKAGGDKNALHRWQKGEMTNFEYLMHLNTLAGRTYNDLMQYPVFPWILADYDSETVDLSSPNTFRDLSKPMGAQTDKRRERFIQRYNEVENNDGDLSAQCHYCTHYSSAIIVASFLVRMEPFSQTFLSLQGGSFDVADRMFHCVKKDWESASRDNMSDVRELIPEFYYLPDFLVNSNNFELGCTQDGTTVGDVVLPPWAKGDPQEFIRMHREALECDYVSSHLHLWIDLIFGYKQQGSAAVDAVNTFHPYFYADKLDLGNMKDPLKKSTVLGFVSNFGQIPKQLFSKPHPPRSGHKSSVAKEITITVPFFYRLDKLKPSIQPLKELTRGPVGCIICGEKELLTVEKNRLLMPPLWNIFFAWGFPDNTCAFGTYGSEKNITVCESLTKWGECLCAVCPCPSTLITAGTSAALCIWDVSFSKDKLQHMGLKQVLYGHTDAVTCLAASEAYNVIVSGSRDRSCILWDLEELSYITQLPGHGGSLTALAINELTGEIASSTGPCLYLWTMKGQLLSWFDMGFGAERAILCCCFMQKHEWDPRNVLVTGCSDGIVRMWKTEYSRRWVLANQGAGSPHEPTAVQEAGKTWERRLVLFQELNRSQTISRQRYKNNPAVTALAVSRTYNSLLVGDVWGRVFSWSYET
ncbi:WD repeat- and FYVE domain-containing protein 4 isoform X2 [Paramormyrops kingsleyae]|uniref:WD repeat- and FYVE domain-containing protein 4 isoform X2 n=1 Tax=Paramormyrops kingsleyae TaxID=1676925 RepID=UPI000CD5D34B|nr:WD repeat- and FYVE domain-containing protein 4 isoform X2 [Paramormyrops kingsleyae]